MVPLSKKERDRLPPPQRGCKRPEHRFEFTYDEKAAERDAEYDGYSVLVTTAPRTQSADLLFTKYKQQSYSELANHEFKTPLAVHPVFLKSPQPCRSFGVPTDDHFDALLPHSADLSSKRSRRRAHQRKTHHHADDPASLQPLHAHHPSHPPRPRSTANSTHNTPTPNPSATRIRYARPNTQPATTTRSIASATPSPIPRLQCTPTSGKWD